MFSLMYHTQL